MTQYLMSVYHTDGIVPLSEEDMQKSFAQTDVFNTKLQEAGAWVFAGGLHPVDTATVVDGNRPELLLTDGPFAESKEHLGGFWIIEAADLDAAIEWARQGSIACMNPVEVRPFQG